MGAQMANDVAELQVEIESLRGTIERQREITAELYVLIHDELVPALRSLTEQVQSNREIRMGYGKDD